MEVGSMTVHERFEVGREGVGVLGHFSTLEEAGRYLRMLNDPKGPEGVDVVDRMARRGQFDLYQWRKGAWEDWNLTPCRRRPWEDET
jgi:hypothetical protein